jgi:oligopeptide/dipeptide ABC transporter ATP-binding protein
VPEQLVLSGAGLVKEFPARRAAGPVVAVDGVDIEVRRGELVAVVGESGSGKSTLGRLLMALTPPTAGQVSLGGTAVAAGSAAGQREFWRSVQLVFQDPFGCLNPTRTVGQTLSRPYRNYLGRSRAAAAQDVCSLLESVRLTPGSSFLHRYPHELSGGQRQRVVLARALSVDPQFVIADEPVSMLDVSVRAGILALMASIQRERGAGFLYITHDLVSAHQIADRIVVMFGGRIVESGSADAVIRSPGHPYTRVLLDAIPGAVVRLGTGAPAGSGTGNGGFAAGAAGEGRTDRAGCPFAARCASATSDCRTTAPPAAGLGPSHTAWCFHPARPPERVSQNSAE